MSKHQYPSPFSCQSATPLKLGSTVIQPVFDGTGQHAGQVVIQNNESIYVASECALIKAQDAIRCACDLLRQNAPGKALEVLEAQLKK